MPVEELHKSDGAALRVTAAPNLTSFRRLCRSAIDHDRQSTNTGQCADRPGVQFGGGGNTSHTAVIDSGCVLLPD